MRLLICPACSARIDGDVDRCPECGAEFENEDFSNPSPATPGEIVTFRRDAYRDVGETDISFPDDSTMVIGEGYVGWVGSRVLVQLALGGCLVGVFFVFRGAEFAAGLLFIANAAWILGSILRRNACTVDLRARVVRRTRLGRDADWSTDISFDRIESIRARVPRTGPRIQAELLLALRGDTPFPLLRTRVYDDYHDARTAAFRVGSDLASILEVPFHFE
jgi:hypothetical protein